MPTTISIVVFRGDFLDLVEFRDAAFYVIYSDGRQALMLVLGTPGFFEFAEQDAKDPRDNDNFAGLVHVSLARDSVSRAAMEAAFANTAVQNDSWHRA
jgi:hypothetical protein